jgi:DHA1 family tetracycline resistance protein-like MFS transporter
MSVFFQLGVVGRLTERIGVRAASNLGFAAACIYFVVLPFMHTIVALLCAQVLFSFALSMTNATLATLLTDAAPNDLRGTVLGVGSSLEAVAGIIMPTISAAILTYYGPSWTGACSAFFCFIALVLGIVAQRKVVARTQASL